MSEEKTASPKKRVLPEPAFSRVVEYIHAHLAKELTVAELAAVAGLSPTHFSRLFAGTTGSTPYQFVLACRLDKAKGLLSSSSMTIAETALATGFASQSHLTDQFKRRFGLAPGALTNRHT